MCNYAKEWEYFCIIPRQEKYFKCKFRWGGAKIGLAKGENISYNIL